MRERAEVLKSDHRFHSRNPGRITTLFAIFPYVQRTPFREKIDAVVISVPPR